MNKNKGFPLPLGGVRGGLLLLLMLLPLCGYAQTLEYWFDDQFAQRTTTTIASTDAMQELELDLRDNAKFPTGFHTLNMRVTIGGKPSAVYSSGVLKLAAGKISKLEYWLDDDLAHSKTIGGKESTDGTQFQFLDSLDLTDATPGYHLLHCRAVSNSGKTASAVITTPIMVKSLYNSKAANAKMVSYTIAIDNGKPMEMPIINDKPEGTNVVHTVDARNLTPGEHTLKASFKNSFGVSTMIEEPFRVEAPESPTLTVTAWLKNNNWLELEFNSIPNDVSYVIMEKCTDGKDRMIWKYEGSVFPNTITALPDNAVRGKFIYYVIAKYIDRSGNEKEIISDEVAETKWISPESTYGCIVGKVNFSDMEQTALLSPHKQLFVIFSDGTENKRMLVNTNGTFKLDYIPFGTTWTLTIEDDDYYTYESITVDVDETTRNKIQTINATARDDVALNVSNERFDLICDRYERWEDRTFELTVRNNISTYETWSGILEIIAFKAKDASNIEMITDDEVTFSSAKPYYHVGSAYIKSLNFGETTDISITLENLPILKKDEKFVLYFVTQKEDKSTTKQYKQLVFNYPKGDERFGNPKTLTIAPDPKIDGTEYVDIDEFITEILKIMKECDTYNGPFSKALLSVPDKIVKSEWKKKDNAFLYTMPAILLSFTNDLKKVYKGASKLTKPIRDFYDELKDAYDITVNPNNSPFDKFLKFSKNVFKTYGKYSGDPFAKLYTLYMDVTEKAVDKIMEYQDKLINEQIGDIFMSNDITFKIKVANYDASSYADDIDFVDIYMETLNGGSPLMARYHAIREKGSKEVKLSRTFINQNQGQFGQDLKEFYMTIFWKNGRVMHIPLNEPFSKWDKNGQNVRNITVNLKCRPSCSIAEGAYFDY